MVHKTVSFLNLQRIWTKPNGKQHVLSAVLEYQPVVMSRVLLDMS